MQDRSMFHGKYNVVNMLKSDHQPKDKDHGSSTGLTQSCDILVGRAEEEHVD